jgi:cell division protease FtsH
MQQNYSEETARKIDVKIHDLIEAQRERAYSILTSKRPQLEAMAAKLLEAETLDADALKQFANQRN